MFCQATAKADSARRLRHIILQSLHLGAHGLGYNTKSLVTLSKQLNAADVLVLLGMVHAKGMAVGVLYALASLDAEDALSLIEGYQGCPRAPRFEESCCGGDENAMDERHFKTRDKVKENQPKSHFR